METNSKNGGLLPSVIALNASLNQRLGTSSEPTMLTPYEIELLRQSEREASAMLAQSDKLQAWVAKHRLASATETT